MHYRSLFGQKRRLYLDNAALTPTSAPALRAFLKAERLFTGNPSSLHKEGVKAARALKSARAEVAKILDTQPSEIIFTGSGTESDSLAILGSVRSVMASKSQDTFHAVTTAIEHPAVLEVFRQLEREGVIVTYLPVSGSGLVDQKELREALRPDTVIVSIEYVNSEIGVIQNIRECAKTIRHFRKQLGRNTMGVALPFFHTDAAQALRLLPTRIPALGVDMLSCNASKIGAVRGVGVLYCKNGISLTPQMRGGGQESGLRSGTENVPAIVAFVKALQIAQEEKEHAYETVLNLRKYFLEYLENKVPSLRINGAEDSVLPSTVSVSIPNFTSELLMIELDARGVAVSAGSACSGVRENGSHVLAALYGEDDKNRWGTVRISFTKHTTRRELRFVVLAIADIMEKYANVLYT